ncbi:MAG: hydantoinase B/oxoprolinase family protein [Pseudomonadota bacterium]
MSAATRARAAVDIGGTFTDVAIDAPSGLVTYKTPTTPAAPEEGALAGLTAALQKAGLAAGDLAVVIHGTTLATNALIERRGAKTALLTTHGHRDVLEIARENRFAQYDLAMNRAAPLIPRALRLPVRERMAADGAPLLDFDPDSLRATFDVLDAAGVESVAVGFLHSYANDAHEQAAAVILQAERPQWSVTLSSAVAPSIREYERFSTAAANAYVRPLMDTYLRAFQERLTAAGAHCPFLLMTSGGGLADLETAARFPIRLVESGPAGGAVLAARIARDADERRVLSFDMGGTTAKLCLIDDFTPATADAFEIDRAYRFQKGSGLPVTIPVVELVEIGAGGGSIAKVDGLGRIAVGPESAGAAPGPAAYGKGGAAATVTDADGVLGRIDPDGFAAGAVAFDVDAARAAVMQDVGAPLNLDAHAAAGAVAEVVDEAMAAAARAHAAENGVDAGGRTLIAFGGAAPLHAARVADKLRAARIVVPAGAGVGSAIGFLLAPAAYDVTRSDPGPLSALDPTAVAALFDAMRLEAGAVVDAAAGPGPRTERRTAHMRYAGQGFEVAVPIDPDDALDAAGLRAAFEARYAALFGRTIPGADVLAVSWSLRLEGPAPALRLAAETPGDGAAAPPRRARDGRSGGGGGWRGGCDRPRRFGRRRTDRRAGGDRRAANDDRRAERFRRARGRARKRRARTNGRRAVSTLDPLTFTLLWNRLLAVVEDQAQTLIRTSFSATVREAGDLSAGVFDRQGRMLAQAVTGTPGHVNAMAASVGFFLEAFPLDTLRDGDVLVTNDPWLGTGHLNDFTVVTPVFRDGAAIALFAATSHIADVGGLGFGPDGRDVYEEGLAIPIMKLFDAGAPNDALFQIVRANVRDPATAEGDLYSLAACNAAGARRLLETMDEFGVDDLGVVGARILAESEAATRRAVRALPAGAYAYAMRIDGYDAPLDLVCTVTITEDGALDVDFDGTAAAVERGVNVPLTYAQAYASFGARIVAGPEVPNNAGSLAPVVVRAPPGCVLNAERPAPVSARHVVGQMLPDLVLGALAQAAPDKTPAEGASCLYLPVLRSAPGAAPFVVNPFFTGGTGARAFADGLSCTAFPSGVRATPVEINETDAPIVVWRKELRVDSGGAGARRGGLGQRFEFAGRRAEAMTASAMFDRIDHPARGRDGGRSGAPGGVRLVAADGAQGKRPGMGRIDVPAGARLVIDTPGGGGVGPPAKRDPAQLRADVVNGYVSAEAAARDYSPAAPDERD